MHLVLDNECMACIHVWRLRLVDLGPRIYENIPVVFLVDLWILRIGTAFGPRPSIGRDAQSIDEWAIQTQVVEIYPLKKLPQLSNSHGLSQ